MNEYRAPANDEELKERLCRKLRIKKIPARLLDRFEPEFRDALFGGEEAFRCLVRMMSAELKRIRQQKRMRAREVRGTPVKVDSLLDPRERIREQVFTDELARLALVTPEWDPMVVRFRKYQLGGAAISDAAALGVLNSPAAAYLRWWLLERPDIPLVGHTSRILSRTEGHDPKGLIKDWEQIDFAIDWEGGHHETFIRRNRRRDDRLELRYPDGRGGIATIRVRPDSPLGQLREMAIKLADKYLWQDATAAWFILTNATPPAPAFRAHLEGGVRNDHLQLRLNLSIQPWVSGKTVMRVYRSLQQEIIGHENRHPRLDSLELMGFVAKLRHDGLSWRDCLTEWNRTHAKQQRYRREEVRNFRRDFEAAYTLVMAPRYQAFGFPPRSAEEKTP